MDATVAAEAVTWAVIVKDRAIPSGVSVSRLKSGNFTVVVDDGDRRALVELTRAELADLLGQLTMLAAGTQP